MASEDGEARGPQAEPSGGVLDAAAIAAGKEAVRAFLRSIECYEIMPDSGKVVVFDVNIPVRLAFYALVEHEVNSAPVWDTDVQDHVGMFTVSDFIEIMRYFRAHSVPHDDYAKMDIRMWRQLRMDDAYSASVMSPPLPSMPPPSAKLATNTLLHVPPSASLYEAVEVLCRNRIHRLPILDAGQQCVVTICSHMHVLQYLVRRFAEPNPLFPASVAALGIGTYSNVAAVSPETPLGEVLEIIVQRRVSCVPVLDREGRVVDVYSRHYIILMAKEQSPLGHLEMPVGELLAAWHEECGAHTGLVTCCRSDSLHDVLEKFAVHRVHTMVSVDERGVCDGVISLTDVLSFFLESS